MDLHNRIRACRRATIIKLKQGDTSYTLHYASILEQLERAEEDLDKLEDLVENIDKNIASDRSLNSRSSVVSYPNLADKGAAVGRQRGSVQRERFISKLRTMGIVLSPHSRKTVFKSNLGNVIGVSYASERSNNRWFLGAPVEEYDALVLLCEGEDGNLEEFILPGELINRRRESLESQNQLKFNITCQGGSYYLLIPGGDREDLGGFRANYDLLKEE